MNTKPPETSDNTASSVESASGDRTRPGWYTLLFGPTFILIGFFYRAYNSNRERLASLVSRPRVSSLIRVALVMTVFLWIAIWLFAPDESRNRLTEAARQQFRSLESTFGN